MGSVPFELPSSPSPWVETPCYRSEALSRAAGCSIFLKLDNLQPSGSFKSRGIGNLMSHAVQSHPPGAPLHFYCSSGGNAGLACVTAANTLSRRTTIVVPHSTPSVTITKLRRLGATVHQHGESWADADAHLRSSLLAHDPAGIYVPPFDHPHIWAGHASIIPELDRQLGAHYDAIVCSVGGGGLLCGIVQGLDASPRRRGADDVHILGVETRGADSLAHSLAARTHLALPGISSIATSLGCVRVAAQTWKVAQRPNVTSLVLSDAEAAMACVRFADEERMLIEISCGVSIAAVYGGHLRRTLGRGMSDEEWRTMRVVVEICGGSGVSLRVLEGYKEVYGPVVEEMKTREEKDRGIETGKGGVQILGETDGNRRGSAVTARGKIDARDVFERERTKISLLELSPHPKDRLQMSKPVDKGVEA